MAIRVLSLDDEPEMGELIRLILGREGYELMYSSNSYEAWAMLHTGTFDVFMQDLMRPDVDGWEVCEALRSDESLRDVAMIIVTAKSASIDPPGLPKGFGPVGYVTKPFGPRELLSAVEDALEARDAALSAKGAWRDLQRTSDQPLQFLDTTLRDPDPSKRRKATRALTLKNEPGAVDLLIGALADEDRNVQASAVWGLELIGGLQAVEPLIGMLSNKSWQVRGSAARALGRLRDDRALEPLMNRLRDESCYVRLLAVVGLGRIGDKRTLKAVSSMTSDEDSWVSRAAAQAHTRIRESDQNSRKRMLLASRYWDRKKAAQFLPGANNKEVFDYLIDASQDTNPDVRHAAVASLRHLSDRYAVEPLIAMLEDESARVREEAIGALYAIGDRRAAGPIATRLSDNNVSVRREAARVLGCFRDRRSIEPLTAALQDDDKEVCNGAALSLALLDDVRSEEQGV